MSTAHSTLSEVPPRTKATAPLGTINFFETHIGAWEESASREFLPPEIYGRFRAMLARLRDHRGFRIAQDTKIDKLIRRGYYVGRKGDLEFRAKCHGRTFNIEFFQNVNVENRAGGQYDFRKFERMPRTMKLQCAVEMSHVLRKLLELGYIFTGERQGIMSAELLPVLRHAQGRTDDGDELAKFNRGWTNHRFERDESGWPTIKAVHSCWSTKDRDGLPIVSGDEMYYRRRRRGRLFRGIARPIPNGSWILLSNDGARHAHANEMFRCADPSAEPRRFVPKQAERVRAELEKALKANDYRRVETLGRVASRLSHPISTAPEPKR